MSELREALESAMGTEPGTPPNEDRIETAPATPEPATPEPAATEAPAGGDDTEGAAAKPVSAAPAKAEPAAAKADTPAEIEAEAKRHRVDRPPQSWKNEAKGEWANIPLHVRQEVYRREQQVNQVLEENRSAREFANSVQQVVSPFMARIRSMDATPIQAIESLLRADYALSSSPMPQRAQYMATLIKQYGVDIAELDAALSGQANPQRDQFGGLEQRLMQSLEQKFAPVMTFAQQTIQQRQQAEFEQQQKANQTVGEMALDPKYPYFEELREEMADIIELFSRRGIYITPQEAYNKVSQLNPEVSGQLLQQQELEKARQVNLQAQKAKVAASSVSGAPVGGGSQGFGDTSNLRGTIEAAFGGQRL